MPIRYNYTLTRSNRQVTPIGYSEMITYTWLLTQITRTDYSDWKF